MPDLVATLLDPFDDYDVYYDGRVYSRKTDKFLKPYPDYNHGYAMVRLYDKRGQRYDKSLGRLVAETFVNPPSIQHAATVVYKNYDPSDCHADNLAWRSRPYALRYRKQKEYRDRFDTPAYRVRRYHPSSNENPQPFGTLAQAAEAYGLLFTEIYNTAVQHIPVHTIPDLGFVLEG